MHSSSITGWSRSWALAVATLVGSLMASPLVLAEGNPAWPSTIALPNGWQPEGIAAGPGKLVFSGSIATGSIYVTNVRTGEGRVLVEAPTGRVAVGLKWDERTGYLYVAGGPTGMIYVYEARTGEEVAVFTVDDPQGSFVNDVVVTRDAVYFTDSYKAQFYRIDLGHRGKLPAAASVETIPLGGDFELVPGQFNSNGIVASSNGRSLIIVHSSLGLLYRVDPDTGEASAIDLGGALVINGDGLLRLGRSLYVVENFSNLIQEVRLDREWTTGTLGDTLTNPAFDVPTTIARVDGALYAVNARFTVPPTPATEYHIVRTPLPER
jgi:outer membrane protein assembly factor BamB